MHDLVGKTLGKYRVVAHLGIDHLEQEVVLPAVQAVLTFAFARDARAHDFGQSIDVDGAQTGTIGTAYLATKVTQPLRILVTLAITPFVAMAWHRIRGRKPTPAAEPPKPE